MPLDKSKLIGAIFDVKPVDQNGRLDVAKMEGVNPILCLKKKNSSRPDIRRSWRENQSGDINVKVAKPEITNRATYVMELERALETGNDSVGDLSNIGAILAHSNVGSRARIKPIVQNYQKKSSMLVGFNDETIHHAKIIAEIEKRQALVPSEMPFVATAGPDLVAEKVSSINNPGSGEIRGSEMDIWLDRFQKNKVIFKQKNVAKDKFQSTKLLIAFGIVLIIGAGVYYGLGLKDNVVKGGNSAVQNLEEAKDQIKKMDFSGAAGSFSKAYEEFSKASENLNFMGASIGTLLADLPGANKIKSANNILEAGKLLADSGKVMAQAMEFIAKSGSILNPTSTDGSMAKILNSLKSGLGVSQRNLQKADILLTSVDEEALPEDKRANFIELKSRLPAFNELITMGVDYARFLEDLVGIRGAKRYLLLFQNPAELRPTGGFPGSYGVISFQDGQLKEFFVDDIYNLDGQLKENIIPPIQMQHITPTWGMRDASWFVDFPTSAKKIMSFYKKESGADVDGVITFSPVIVAKILGIVGPIEMPEYDLVLNSQNFAAEIQSEVEYGKNRTQPKQILKDMAPKLLANMYLANNDEWMAVFNILISSMERKDVLMYFKNLSLQSFAYDKGFTGHVQSVNDDYLMVNVSNIKGSKTDSVTDTSIKIDTKLENGNATHKLTITRKNNGGDQKYGFYNKTNPAYVRVLVPEGSELLGVSGNSSPEFKPLVSYSKSDFKKDEDLLNFESSTHFDKDKGVAIQREAGKTEFAFWMIINPKKEQTVELEYTVPMRSASLSYELYIQKQPGLVIDNFEFSLDGQVVTKKIESVPVLNKIGDRYILNGALENDLLIKVDFE